MALKLYDEQCESLYDLRFQSYNIHQLLHLVEDVRRFGYFDNFSAFVYENNIRILRQFCRKPDRPLQQIVNRNIEHTNRTFTKNKTKNLTQLLRTHKKGPLIIIDDLVGSLVQYSVLKNSKFLLSVFKSDNCCMLNNLSICIIFNIVLWKNETFLIIRKFELIQPWFEVCKNFDSQAFGSYRCLK